MHQMLERVLQKYGTLGSPRIEVFDLETEFLVREILLNEKFSYQLIEVFGIQSEEDFYCYGFDVEPRHLKALLKRQIIEESLDFEKYSYSFTALHPMYLKPKYKK